MGFNALDFILKMNGGSWTASSSDFVAADITIDGKPLTLFKPLTYMNVCGQPVADFVDSRAIQSSDILVCFDDVALPLGAIRLRERGRDGGHNGLASVLAAIGTNNVPRLRIGIKPKFDNLVNNNEDARALDLREFVLAPFSVNEWHTVMQTLERVFEATRMVLSTGMAKAMSQFNSKIVSERY